MTLWNTVRDSVKLILLYVFGLSLIGFGCWGLHREHEPKATDPHAIIVAVGLLILPFFPTLFASSVKQVGGALIDAWKAKNAPPAGPP